MHSRGRTLAICIGLVLGLVLGQGLATSSWATDITGKSQKEIAALADTRPQTSYRGGLIGDLGGGRQTLPLAPLVVLYDQTANINENATSQNFEAANDAYDNQAADDFVVTAGGGWNVTTVFAPGVYSATHGVPTSMRVAFYADNAGVPGALICDFPTAAFVEAPIGTFTIALPGGCILSPGTKWVSVVANLAFGGGGGQWFWSTRTVLTGNPSKWQNPGGGFATPCTTWGTRTVCLTGQTDPDMAFRLEGELASCSTDPECDNGNLCDGVETCQAGSCVPGTPVVCDDGLFCTIDSCVPATGACTTVPNTCNDGNPCTTDFCDEAADACTSIGSPPVRICNPTSIVMPASGTAAGIAAPYPSPIVVAGLPSQANVCSVELLGMNHTWSGDVDIMLASPLGGTSNRTIMSDVGGSGDLVNSNVILTDGAANPLPASGGVPSGTYRPTNSGAVDTFDAPAPAPTGLAPLSGFDGINPNGTWNLWVRDDAGGDVGNISGGWCLNLVTSSCTNDAECGDGNFCNGIETCDTGTGNCQPGTSVNCDDGQFCTFDSCVPATGACEYVANPCADTDGCTTDTCNEGSDSCDHISNCVSYCNTTGVVINDGTAPSTPATPYPTSISVAGLGVPASLAQVRLLGLSHTFPDDIDMLLVSPYDPLVNATIMSDVGLGTDIVGINLTLSDAAAASLPDGGPLVSGTFKPTNIDTTTDAFAAPAPARTNLSALSTFGTVDLNGNWDLYIHDDANIDSGAMVSWCLDFLPVGGCSVDADCDDADACTTDVCVAGECQNNPANCDDNNACTTDSCDPASGCTNTPIVCDDGNACTADSCDPASGCVYTTISCDDGNACTTDSCDPASGCVNAPISCDDGNACTTDSCDPASGCVYTPLSCDDGNVCTVDTCDTASGCVYTTISCDDGNVCTDDSCDPVAGCVYTDNLAPCDDGNACTTTDSCSGGACVGRDPVVCTALDSCHLPGVCDPATGACTNPTSPNGTACDDDNTCTTSDACFDGVCVGDPTAITEPNPRTNGYYKRLCHGPHSGDELTAADAACVAEVAPATFGWVASVADVCGVIQPSSPNSDKCQQSEDDLMVLALNICKARVCPSQGIDSQCGSNSTVAESLAEADAIFSDPSRDFQSCQHGKCITEEINTGRALVMNSLRLAKAAGGGLTLSWTQPYVDDGQTIGAYKVWRRVHGNGAFVKIATVTDLTFTDPTSGDFDYEVTAVRQN